MFLRRGALRRGVVLGTLLLFAICAIFRDAIASPPAGYYLVWGDEFNTNSLDTTKWDYWVPGKWGDAVNVSNAVSVNGSNLVITTYTTNNINYTSIIASDNHFRPRYGYYEASIQWGDTNGEWSAFWLRSPTMGTWLNDAFVSGAEIDCCEHRYVGIYETNYIANIVSDNIHWDGYGSQEQSAGSPNVGSNLQTGFHTYGFLWNGPAYSFTIDGSQVWNGTPAPLFGSDVYIILSSQVDDTSTTWAGYIPTNGYGNQLQSTVKLTVDYFRYYAPTNVLFFTGGTSVYWTNAANWVSNMIPNSACDLTFSYLTTRASNVLGSNYTVDGLVFLNMTNTPSINGTNILTIGAGGIDMVAANQSVTLNAPIKIGSNQKWTVGISGAGSNLTVNSAISGSDTLTKAGYGTLVFAGTNSFSGTLNVDSGSSITNDGVMLINGFFCFTNAASPIYLRNGGAGISTLRLENANVSQAVSVAGRSTSVLHLEAFSGANNTLGGGLLLAGGGPNYTLQSDGGTFRLGGVISASTASACNLIMQGSGYFSVSGSIQNGSGTVTLLKTNLGTLILSGTNTFTGGMTNWDGAVYVNGSIASPLTMASGTLAGIGTINGNTAIQSAEISCGTAAANSIGTLSIGGNLTLGSASSTVIEISASPQTNSLLNIAGTLNAGGALSVVNLSGTLTPGQSFQIFKAGTFAGGFASVNLPALNSGYYWNTNNIANGIVSVGGPPVTLTLTNIGGGQYQLI